MKDMKMAKKYLQMAMDCMEDEKEAEDAEEVIEEESDESSDSSDSVDAGRSLLRQRLGKYA